MFNLEQAIAEWRRKMMAAGIKTPVPLEELETHLREEIQRQVDSGRSAAEAFKSAAEKFGPAQVIQKEFQKVGEATEVRKWKEEQIRWGAILGALQLVVIGAILFNSLMTFSQRMSGLAAIAASILLVALAGRVSYRFFPVVPRRSQTAVVLILGVPLILASLVLARLSLPGHEFPFGEWLARVLWVCCPFLGVYLGLIWGIQNAAQEKAVSEGL